MAEHILFGRLYAHLKSCGLRHVSSNYHPWRMWNVVPSNTIPSLPSAPSN